MVEETKDDVATPVCLRCGAPLDPRGEGVLACSDCGYEEKIKVEAPTEDGTDPPADPPEDGTDPPED